MKKITNQAVLESEINAFGEGCLIIWTHENITIQNKKIPDISEIVELRIFNADKELLVKRIGKDLFYRLKDDTGKAAGTEDYVEKQAVVRGNIAEKVKVVSSDLALSKTIAILKREYIDYNYLGVAGYVDSRFVNFKTLN